MGPFQVKGLGNQRARIKVYGLVIVCQNTRAVKLLPVPGYDTASFLVAYRRFTNDFGTPELIISDRGSQLVKAGKILNVERQDLDDINWTRIRDLTARSGTEWKFVEAGCQWRNGLVERQVASLKKTLRNSLEPAQHLNFAELDSLFSSAAYLVNQRPLSVETFGQDDLRCITPNDLLLGRNKVPVKCGDVYGENDNIPLRLQFLEDLEKLWWQQWIRDVFPSLLPYRRWKTEFRNLKVGDIVLVQYASRIQRSDYRLARVAEVHPDPHGTVRTVTVAMRPRDAREKVTAEPPHLQPKPETLLRLGVQRVVVILPIEEQNPSRRALNPEVEPFLPKATEVKPPGPQDIVD